MTQVRLQITYKPLDSSRLPDELTEGAPGCYPYYARVYILLRFDDLRGEQHMHCRLRATYGLQRPRLPTFDSLDAKRC